MFMKLKHARKVPECPLDHELINTRYKATVSSKLKYPYKVELDPTQDCNMRDLETPRSAVKNFNVPKTVFLKC